MAERQLEQMAPLLKNVQRLGGSGPGSRRRDVFLRSFQVAAQQQESASTQKAEREVSHMVVVMVGEKLIVNYSVSLAKTETRSCPSLPQSLESGLCPCGSQP